MNIANKNMTSVNITYLGPEGATFSALAYTQLSKLCGAPLVGDVGSSLSLASANEEILPILLERGGYGAIAMETKAEGKVDPPINSFIDLLKSCDEDCPIQVLAALRMKIHFALMAQPGLRLDQIKTVIAHPKAFGACKGNLRHLGAKLIDSPSNGKAAEDVSRTALNEGVAALGPVEAAMKNRLDILNGSFGDTEAITTFLLLGPRSQQPVKDLNRMQRAISIFRVRHQPGALVKVLLPFGEEDINLRLIHSLHIENGTYHFAIETESLASRNDSHERAIRLAHEQMERRIQFGPFPVISE